MEVITNRQDLQAKLLNVRHNGAKTGFVATMGALHQGHASLIDQSVAENDLTIASIFVNPAQFNDPSDLTNYPRTPEEDKNVLSTHGCNYVFTPSVSEIYPKGIDLLDIDLGSLATVMEGKYRKGHFQGMVTVVYKLLTLISPANAYFGEKDFQQLAIIRYMEKKLGLGINIIGCSTVREADGLALSSRNIHLLPQERSEAPIIFNSMMKFTSMNHLFGVSEIKEKVVSTIEKSGLFKVDYFDIVDSESLQSIENWNEAPSLRACIAVKTSKTRLIDNVPVKFAVRG